MADEDNFPLRLKELRQGKNLTQTQLAHAAGLTLDYISRLERADRSPSWATVCALANVFGVSTEEFRRSTTADPKPRGRPRKAAAGKRKKKGGGE